MGRWDGPLGVESAFSGLESWDAIGPRHPLLQKAKTLPFDHNAKGT